MKRYNAQADRMNLGPFSDLFIIGATRGANGASDFTVAGLQQDFALMTPAAGDQIIYPLCLAYTKVGFVGPSLTAVALDLGRGAGGAEGMLDGAMFAAGASAVAIGTAGAGGPASFNGAQTLNARVDATGANLSAITAGEIWIFVNIFRARNYVASVNA